MAAANAPDLDMDRARQIWSEYQHQHDLSSMKVQAVGVDPETREVFLGDSALAIGRQLETEGRFRPLCFFRIGYPTYLRKGMR